MPYFPVDDKAHSHRKFIKAGVAAIGLWTFCGSWSNDHGTDGFIPDYIAARFTPDYETLGARLVEVRLWEVAEQDGEKGWQFHDWTGEGSGAKRNFTKAEVEQKRRDQAERKARSRQRSHETGKFVTRDNPVTHAGQSSDSRETHAGQKRDSPIQPEIPGNVTRDSHVTTASRHTAPIPSHPIPSLEPKSQNQEPLTAVDPLTRHPHENVSRTNIAPRHPESTDPETRWSGVRCPEDRHIGRIIDCADCRREYRDAAWYTKHPYAAEERP